MTSEADEAANWGLSSARRALAWHARGQGLGKRVGFLLFGVGNEFLTANDRMPFFRPFVALTQAAKVSRYQDR